MVTTMWSSGSCGYTLAPHAWRNDMQRLYFFECARPLNYLCLWRIGDRMTMLETMYLGGKRKFRRNSPRRTTLPTTVRRCEWTNGTEERRASVEKTVSEESLWKVGVTKEENGRRREDVSSRISSPARSGKNGETISPPSPRPFSISLLWCLSTAAFNDRAGHPRRPFPLFLTRPRRVRRAWQKATNGADSERKECSRRLNWLGNGWFMARFTTADPQSATPPARERREKVREPPSPVASSHASWNG